VIFLTSFFTMSQNLNFVPAFDVLNLVGLDQRI